jgi:hypothetical protein
MIANKFFFIKVIIFEHFGGHSWTQRSRSSLTEFVTKLNKYYIFLKAEWINNKNKNNNTVFLSILTRDRDRTVTVQWPFSTIRSWPFTIPTRSFLGVLDRSWPFLSVPERFLSFKSFYDRLWALSIVLWAFSIVLWPIKDRFDHYLTFIFIITGSK